MSRRIRRSGRAIPPAGSGFTLLELMIVVAIVTILAMVALPSYQNYVMRTNRSVAQQFMLDVANRQEQFMMDRRSYAADIATLGMSAPPELSGKYTFTVVPDAGPPLAFEVRATAAGSQAPDGNLTLASTGAKTPADKWK